MKVHLRLLVPVKCLIIGWFKKIDWSLKIRNAALDYSIKRVGSAYIFDRIGSLQAASSWEMFNLIYLGICTYNILIREKAYFHKILEATRIHSHAFLQKLVTDEKP
jgi:hypothetical protein